MAREPKGSETFDQVKAALREEDRRRYDSTPEGQMRNLWGEFHKLQRRVRKLEEKLHLPEEPEEPE